MLDGCNSILAAISVLLGAIISPVFADDCEPIMAAYEIMPPKKVRKIIPKYDIQIEFMLLKADDYWEHYQNPFDENRFVEGMTIYDECTGIEYILEGNFWHLLD